MTIRVPINFEDVEDRELVDKGVYSAILERLKFIEAKDEDKFPQIQVEYTITEEGDFEGEKLSQWVSLSPKAGFRAKAFFDAFGVPWPIKKLDVDEETGVVVNPNLEDSVVDIAVTIEPHYRDRTRKVNKVNEASGAPAVRKSTYKAGKAAEDDEESDEDEAPRRRRSRDEEAEKPAGRRAGRTIR